MHSLLTLLSHASLRLPLDDPVLPSLAGLKTYRRAGSPLGNNRDSPGSVSRPVFGGNGKFPAVARMTTTLSPAVASQLIDVDTATAVSHSPYPDVRAIRRAHSRNSSVSSLANGVNHMSHHSRNSSLASIGDAESVWINTPEGELVERRPIARLRAPASHTTSTPSSSTLRHPPMEEKPAGAPALYRTSQIPSVMDGSGSPLTNLTNKASLKFEGDLNIMALGWSHDEWLAKRRLVAFTRRQDGNAIVASFSPIALSDITPSSIVISCIFREDKNECFVTSVDTIYLLEALVAVRFTVEEKNRIRRNLEGFKPITVSKSKADSEDFFKLIMGFPVRDDSQPWHPPSDSLYAP